MLQKGASVLQKSDESALSIVPSRSSRLSSIIGSSSRISLESAELVYQQLSIDDDLFTARVYKRNYRHSLMLFKKNEGLDLGKQTLIPSSESEHTIDLDLSDHSLRPITRQTHEPNANGFSTSHVAVDKLLQAQHINAVSEGHEWVSRAQWSMQGLCWTTRNFIDGPAVTPHLHECYLQNMEPYHINTFILGIKYKELSDILRLTGKDYRVWRACLLLEACHQNKDDLVKILLLQDPTIIDGLWREVPKYSVIATRSPLQLAVETESPELVRLLLDKGASHCAISPKFWTVVQQAWDGGESNAVKGLHFDNKSIKISILFLATDSFQFEMVDVLTEKWLDPNSRYPDSRNNTALHRVVMDIARGLCECGHSTTLKGHCRGVQTLQALLQHGADWLAKDIDGNNIYHLIALYGSFVSDCLQTVLHDIFPEYALSCVYTRNSHGETPFQVSMKNRNYAIANVFESEDAVAKYRRIWNKHRKNQGSSRWKN